MVRAAGTATLPAGAATLTLGSCPSSQAQGAGQHQQHQDARPTTISQEVTNAVVADDAHCRTIGLDYRSFGCQNARLWPLQLYRCSVVVASQASQDRVTDSVRCKYAAKAAGNSPIR
jgi:hypothetical protein